MEAAILDLIPENLKTIEYTIISTMFVDFSSSSFVVVIGCVSPLF
jgi:hypothetical protein